MKSFFLATFAMAITMVFGQANPVYITAPLTGATYTAGSTIQIRWMNPVSETITQIVLAKGLATNIQPVSTIASNVATASGSYSWTIPADTPAGSDYAFALGTSPDVAYTGQFTINAAASGATTTTTTTTAAASGSSTVSASETESASVSASASSAILSAASSIISSASAVVSSSAVAPSSAPVATQSVSRAVSSVSSRSASASLTAPTTFDSSAKSTKASMCAIVMTVLAVAAFM